jgi:hypothetical protein
LISSKTPSFATQITVGEFGSSPKHNAINKKNRMKTHSDAQMVPILESTPSDPKFEPAGLLQVLDLWPLAELNEPKLESEYKLLGLINTSSFV